MTLDLKETPLLPTFSREGGVCGDPPLCVTFATTHLSMKETSGGNIKLLLNTILNRKQTYSHL